MASCPCRKACQDRTVDTKGAQELARLLAERNGTMPEPEPPPPVTTSGAAPIFRWFGIEPNGEPASRPAVPDVDAPDPSSA
jgi:hypothetical protein